MKLLYNISINLYTSLIYIASIFNKKAKLWVNGRKDIFMKLEKAIPKNKKSLIFSSDSEYENMAPKMVAKEEYENVLKKFNGLKNFKKHSHRFHSGINKKINKWVISMLFVILYIKLSGCRHIFIRKIT